MSAGHRRPFLARESARSEPIRSATRSTAALGAASPARTHTSVRGGANRIQLKDAAPAIIARHKFPPAQARSEIMTAILLTALIHLLAGYDPQLMHYLIHGFNEGFAIGSINVQSTFDPLITNLKSEYQLPHVVNMV